MPIACASASASHACSTAPERVMDGQRPVAPQHLSEVDPRQVLHDDVRRAVLERADVEHLGDVLARQGGSGARLALEAADRGAVRRGLAAHELDGDLLTELHVTRGDDDAHPADAEHPLDLVLRGDDLA